MRLRPASPGSDSRPVGNMRALLQDLKSRGVEATVILDVGAHSGAWSRMALGVFPQARCFLVEPLAELGGALEVFQRENPGTKVFAAAAGAQMGSLKMEVLPNALDSSFVVRGKEPTEGQGVRSVPVITIDSLLATGQMPMPQIVKLDVQGYELEALRGGETLFGTTEVFIMETSLFPLWPDSPLLPDVLAFMAERGYAAYDFGGFQRRPVDGALAQTDVCFVKRDGFLRRIHGWKS